MEENNRRFLTTGIAQIDKDLLNITQILSQHESKSLFFVTMDDIGSEARESIMSLVDDMHDQVKQIKENFALEHKSIKKSTSILVHLSDISIILDDVTPKNLENYGKLDQTDANLLDSHLAKIRTMLKEIHSILSRCGEKTSGQVRGMNRH